MNTVSATMRSGPNIESMVATDVVSFLTSLVDSLAMVTSQSAVSVVLDRFTRRS